MTRSNPFQERQSLRRNVINNDEVIINEVGNSLRNIYDLCEFDIGNPEIERRSAILVFRLLNGCASNEITANDVRVLYTQIINDDDRLENLTNYVLNLSNLINRHQAQPNLFTEFDEYFTNLSDKLDEGFYTETPSTIAETQNTPPEALIGNEDQSTLGG